MNGCSKNGFHLAAQRRETNAAQQELIARRLASPNPARPSVAGAWPVRSPGRLRVAAGEPTRGSGWTSDRTVNARDRNVLDAVNRATSGPTFRRDFRISSPPPGSDGDWKRAARASRQ